MDAMETGGGSAPNAAPGELEMVRQFINTRNIEEGTDELSSTNGLRAWFVEQGLVARGAKFAEKDVRFFLMMREGLRFLAIRNNGEQVEGESLEQFNQMVGTLELGLEVGVDGNLRGVPRGGPSGQAAGRILLAVYNSTVEGRWGKLKACKNDNCRWSFYDRSKNHSGKWCSMSVCGNRSKVKRYLSRKHTS